MWLATTVLVAASILGAACARTAFAQDVEQDAVTTPVPPDYRWVRFSQLPGGLGSSDVWSVAAVEDAIWVGTDRGVYVYDGVWRDFETPTAEDSTSPPPNSEDAGVEAVGTDGDVQGVQTSPEGTVLALTGGSDGSVYAGNEEGRVYRWDTHSWTVLGDVGREISSLVEDGGVLYVGTDHGISTLPARSAASARAAVEVMAGTSVHDLARLHGDLYAGTDSGLRRLEDGEWVEVPLQGSLSPSVYALSETGAGIVLGTPDGVWFLDEQYQLVHRVPVTDELERPALVLALANDRYGRTWVGTDGAGAYEVAPDTFETRAHGQAQDANVTIRYVRDVAVDADGSVWFATPTGVYRYQVGMWHSDVQGGSVADPLNHINDLLVAGDGSLWIATGGGGVRRKASAEGDAGAEIETVYAVDEDVPSTVLVLEEDDAGNIWAGTFYGLFRFADGRWSLADFSQSLPNSTVTTLLYDSPNLWIGTEGGLAEYYTPKQTLRVVDEFAGLSVEALELDGLGRLWVGTRTQGVWVREEDGMWTRHAHIPGDEDSLPGNFIIGDGLAADWRNPGHMWALVSRVGLVHWDGQRWRAEDADNQIPVNLLWMLESESEPGRLWIGSEGGVTQFDGRTWGTLSQDDGLQSATTYAIARTDDGGHWIGGATGLTYYVPDSTPPWVRLEGRPSGSGDDEPADIVAQMGSEIAVTFDAGDLQTMHPNLYVLQRLVSTGDSDGSEDPSAGAAGPDEAETVAWVQSEPGLIELPSLDAGAYELQVVARDQSFNYSGMLRVPIEVFVPPTTVNVPGLGRVDPSIFAVILILGVLSILGAGFVMFEVLHRRNRSVAALNRGFNPYISGEPVRSQKMFYGRRDLVQRIADTLHNNSVMIHGERRIGKTTLLYQLALLLREINDPEYWFVPVYVDLEGTPQDHFFHLLIEEIAVAVAKLPDAETAILLHLGDLQFRSIAAEAYDDRAFQRDLHQVSDVLIRYGQMHRPGKQLRLILLLDEMDVMSHYDSIIQQQLRRIFMREFASTVGAVVAGIRISKEWDRIESPWYNMFNEIELEPFTEEEAHALLIEPVAGYYRYDDDALEFILMRSQGRPYRVQQYGLEAVNHMLAGRRRKVNVGDVQQAHERISSAPDLDIGLDGAGGAED